MIKVLYNHFSEGVRDASVILTPVDHIFLRVSGITPEQVAKQSAIRHVSWSQNLIDLLKVIKFGRKPSVNAEDLVVDDGSDWEAVEAMDELFPELQRISSFALIVESVNPVDGTALVVSSQQEKVLGVFNFVRKEQADHLEVLLTPIHVVSQEQVV